MASAAETPRNPALSPAAQTRAAIFKALAGEQLHSVTIDALMRLGVPESLSRQDRNTRKT